MMRRQRAGWLLCAAGSLLFTAGCTTPRVTTRGATLPVSSDPVLADLGIDLGGHHLEQHPDPECRSDWRPNHLRVSEGGSSRALESTAKSYLGTPYVYGGTGADGLDCSGFVNRVYAAHG